MTVGYEILKPGDYHYGLFWDKEGRPISYETYKLLDCEGYRRVGLTYLPSVRVSTVWTGRNTEAVGAPDIFETMTFPLEGEPDGMRTWRYSTLEEAQAGHEAVVAKMVQKEASTS